MHRIDSATGMVELELFKTKGVVFHLTFGKVDTPYGLSMYVKLAPDYQGNGTVTETIN